MTDANAPIPPLVVIPLALSPEHHLLRVLNGSQPTTRHEALAQVLRRFPEYTRLGTPDRPTPTAQSTWERLVNERTNQVPWARFVAQGGQRGFVLTGAGEVRLGVLWHNQVLSPYLRSIAASHGNAVAAAVAALHR